MGALTVYKQMTMSPADLFGVLKQEIGIKSTCIPFAVKAIEALTSLTNLSEQEALKAANTFLDNLQTLTQGGITAEDYDKIDMIKRGKVITISARVEAFLRAAARKGYRITETIIAVPTEDASTTYFKENFYNGDIIYTLEDKRLNADRKITAERLVDGYFDKFICRLEVVGIKQNKRLAVTVCEMTNDDVLRASLASDDGIYKTKWTEKHYPDGNPVKRKDGTVVKEKVVTDELNTGSIWNTWTTPMVEKTVIRRALKRIKEVLPELKDTIYAFDNDTAPELPQEEKIIDIPMEVVNVDLDHLTEQQRADVQETLDLFTANPKLALDKANEIMALFESGEALQKIINAHYASILNIKKSRKTRPILQPMLDVISGKYKRGEVNE